MWRRWWRRRGYQHAPAEDRAHADTQSHSGADADAGSDAHSNASARHESDAGAGADAIQHQRVPPLRRAGPAQRGHRVGLRLDRAGRDDRCRRHRDRRRQPRVRGAHLCFVEGHVQRIDQSRLQRDGRSRHQRGDDRRRGARQHRHPRHGLGCVDHGAALRRSEFLRQRQRLDRPRRRLCVRRYDHCLGGRLCRRPRSQGHQPISRRGGALQRPRFGGVAGGRGWRDHHRRCGQ